MRQQDEHHALRDEAGSQAWWMVRSLPEPQGGGGAYDVPVLFGLSEATEREETMPDETLTYLIIYIVIGLPFAGFVLWAGYNAEDTPPTRREWVSLVALSIVVWVLWPLALGGWLCDVELP